MHIPFQKTQIGLKKYLRSLEVIGEEGRYLDGKLVDRLEDTIAKKCGRQFGVAVGSCSDALFFSLLTSGVGPGDEVIITPFSYMASVNCVLRTGATPRFADINLENYMINMIDLDEKMVTDKTKAIIITHLFGQVIDFDAVYRFAKLHNLIIIEDAAQSLGGSWGDKLVGSMGDFSCLSFDPIKPLGSITTGGMILTDNGETVTKIKMLRNQGKNPHTGEPEVMGYNSRLSEISALVIRDKVETELVKRDSIYYRKLAAEGYRENLGELAAEGKIRLPRSDFAILADNVWTKFVIQADRRNELKEYLRKNGIETRIHYPKALSELSYVQAKDKPQNVKIACNGVLSLPIYSEPTAEYTIQVGNKIKEFYGH